MKKSVLPVALFAAVSLAACGGNTQTAQTAIPVTPSSSSTSKAVTTSKTATPTAKSSHAASSATSKVTSSATMTSTKPTTKAPSAPAHSATAHATSAPAVVTPTKAAPSPTKSASAKPVATATTPATKIVKVWPGAGWKVQTANTDLCNMGMGTSTASPSGFSADTFTCGATFEDLLACKKDSSGNALCIQSYEQHLAVRFKTTATVSGANPSFTMPLAVKLQNGMMCEVAQHDQSPHYQDRHGWFYCDNGGTLLLPAGDDGSTANYFNKTGSTWTAQLGMGTNAPTTVKVAQVYYAQ